MHRYRSHADPPATLARRLARLNGDLVLLGDRLKAAIGTTVGEAVADAVADAVRLLLGDGQRTTALPGSDPWQEEEDPWLDEESADWSVPVRESASAEPWGDVLASALQASLWWLGRPTTPRPLFVALLTLCGGALAALSRPALAAGASAFATLTGLLATVDSAAALTGSRR